MKYLRLSWEDIDQQCKRLAKCIKDQKLTFDLILSLSRGGLVPGRLLSDYLDNNELYTTRVKFYSDIGKRINKPLITSLTDLDLHGKRILLVDDIADTGESLIAVLKHLEKMNPDKISVVTLIKKPQSKFTPDFYLEEINAWVIFPWEVKETINSIKKKGTDELVKAKISEDELKILF
jgi:hypoxanthine phosphoribosyltransferase|tara:strand:- start:1077 stop:1610 length:534 start_codon:yes stop_codon:yes gene_type:complete